MIEEMVNADLIAHVIDSEDSTETERELADRLRCAIEEIEQLATTVRQLTADNMTGAPDGQDTGG